MVVIHCRIFGRWYTFRTSVFLSFHDINYFQRKVSKRANELFQKHKDATNDIFTFTSWHLFIIISKVLIKMWINLKMLLTSNRTANIRKTIHFIRTCRIKKMSWNPFNQSLFFRGNKYFLKAEALPDICSSTDQKSWSSMLLFQGLHVQAKIYNRAYFKSWGLHLW